MTVHVLLVQEQVARKTSIHRALCEYGCTITPAHDARQAVTWARQHQPDLVVLTGPTPEKTDTTCLSLKLQHATNLLPVLLVRHRSTIQDAELSLRVEPDEELEFPWHPVTLSRTIERALRARDEARHDATLAEVRFAMASDPDRLEELLRLLAPWLAGCGLSAYSVQQMTLAVREVGANAIEWGHCYQRERVVRVYCRLDADKVSVLVRDSGPGFDRGRLPHAARPGDPLSHLAVRAELRLRDGGFGILMASGLVDHLCYNETGNEAQLLKFLPARARAAVTALTEAAAAPLQS
jgi:anti-sigma regulatory factor (Ser/Thr protein kinase)/CheY-like chemotaxis protein